MGVGIKIMDKRVPQKRLLRRLLRIVVIHV